MKRQGRRVALQKSAASTGGGCSHCTLCVYSDGSLPDSYQLSPVAGDSPVGLMAIYPFSKTSLSNECSSVLAIMAEVKKLLRDEAKVTWL